MLIERSLLLVVLWQSATVFLPEKSHGQRSLAVYGLQGQKELDTTETT